MIHLNRQQTIILQALKQAGMQGVNSYDFRFKFHLIQAPVRVKELKEKGFLITTRNKSDKSVDYILVSEPDAKARLQQEKPQSQKRYWITDNKTNLAREVSFEEYQRHYQSQQERIFA